MKVSGICVNRVIRSKRRTVALQVEPDAALIVRVPYGLGTSEIEEILTKRKDWIFQQQEKARARLAKIPVRNFCEGEKLPFLGKDYPLIFRENVSDPIMFEKTFFISERFRNRARDVLESWYRWQARLLLEERAAYFCGILGESYQRIRISGAKTRWGSCSSRGTLSFNWRLIMAPIEALDYVAAHEAVHLQIKNHSRFFWKKVESVYPDYERWKKWLVENQFLMHF